MSERPETSVAIDEPRIDSSQPGGNRLLRRIFKVLLVGALVLYFGATLAILSLRYVVLPDIGLARPRLETELSQALHAQVRIARISARWTGLQPGLDIEGLTITNARGIEALKIPHANAQLAWESFVRLQLVFSRLVVDSPDVLIERDAQGGLSIGGVHLAFKGKRNRAFPNWLLSQRAIVLRGGTLRWRDQMRDAPELTLYDIRFALLNDGRSHEIGLQAQPDNYVLHGPLDFRANFRSALFGQVGDASGWDGTAYAQAGPLDLHVASQYMALPITVDAGSVGGRIWFDFSDGRLSQARGAISGHTLALELVKDRPVLSLPAAELHYDLEQDNEGAIFNVHQLALEFGGETPLSDGTPLIRRLDVQRLSAAYQGPNLGRRALATASGAEASKAIAAHGERFSIDGDAMDVGLLADIARTLPLPDPVAEALERFEPRGILRDYAIAFARPAPSTEQAEMAQRNNKVQAIEHVRFKAAFEGLGVSAQMPKPGLNAHHHPYSGLPGFNNLRGAIDADEGKGALDLDAANASITIRGLFDEPELDFDQLAGRTTWSIKDTADPNQPAIDVKIERLRFANDDAHGALSAAYRKSAPGRGWLDLDAGLDELSVARVPRYLPTSISDKLRAYLGHALVGGTGRRATIAIHGNLDEFPYARPEQHGQFRIEAPFTSARFDPSPWPAKRTSFGKLESWPPFEDIDGRFLIDNHLLRFDIAAGRYRGIKVDAVRGEIADLSDRSRPLTIEGNAHGPLGDMLAYLNESPIPDSVDRMTEKIRATGDARLLFTLAVPRGEPHGQLQTKGRVTLDGNDLTYANLPTVTHLGGPVDFTGRSVHMSGVDGQFLGGPVHGTGGLNEDGSVAVDLEGRVGIDALRSLANTPRANGIFDRLNGTVPYTLTARAAPHTIPDLSVKSNLEGLAIDLPAPAHKTPGETWPTVASLHRVSGGPGTDPNQSVSQIDITSGKLAASYVIQGVAHPVALKGALGVDKPATLPSEGVVAAVDLATLDLDQWRVAINTMLHPNSTPTRNAPPPAPLPATANGNDSGTISASAEAPTAASGAEADGHPGAEAEAGMSAGQSFMPTRIAAHVETLTLLKRHWENVVLGASHDGDVWQANLASNQVSGHVSWRAPAHGAHGELDARLAKLEIPKVTENDVVGRMLERQSSEFPAVDLQVDDLIVYGRSLGKLTVNARNTNIDDEPVWLLDRLELDNPAATLTATGNWRTSRRARFMSPGEDFDNDDPAIPRRTVLDFKLDVHDAGALLTNLGLPRTIENGKGTLAGKVGWRSGPTSINYPTLNGTLSADLSGGTLVKVDPGVAKLLGLLSLQTLLKVLTLNFHDVTGHGLAFDSITATGTIHDGVARTDDFKLVTQPARATMTGTINLVDREESLHVKVIPTLNFGAASVAVAIVNPLLGLATFAGQYLLSESISNTFARDYEVTGPWHKPKIERIHPDGGKMAQPVTEESAN
ncbi:YhdP family protein [Pararobbsia silviterrae]|uniref:TIGR02099 family protein n=1 Tax=Pararobbsia silviterrae TaxID=1792498 RepID=A0A494XDN7_9BURK|nr:YhdP family protein [Pararobbsia silviterrae]RKP48618.1 TIGR02099 family protein [Pararobbsia silviterrae]